jgi:hypothetical protein
MARLFWLLCFVASVVLLFVGYVGVGLGLLAVWVFYRLRSMEQFSMARHTEALELLNLIVSDIPAAERQQRGFAYIQQLNENRARQDWLNENEDKRDWLYRMQNFGLKKDDPRWIK